MRVDDRHREAPIALDVARPQIIRYLTYDQVKDLILTLRQKAKVQMLVAPPRGRARAPPASRPRAPAAPPSKDPKTMSLKPGLDPSRPWRFPSPPSRRSAAWSWPRPAPASTPTRATTSC